MFRHFLERKYTSFEAEKIKATADRLVQFQNYDLLD